MKKNLMQTCPKTQKELSLSLKSLNLVPVEMAMILKPGVVIITTPPCGLGLIDQIKYLCLADFGFTVTDSFFSNHFWNLDFGLKPSISLQVKSQLELMIGLLDLMMVYVKKKLGP